MSPRQPGPPIADRVLDGAAGVVARHGIGRTTMDDVARATGCSRQTLYKHYRNKDDLLATLFVREVQAYLELLEAGEFADAADAFAFTVRFVRIHPLVRGVREADEQGILAIMTLGKGRVLSVIHEGVTARLERFIRSGAIREVEPELLGEVFVRLVTSFVLLPRWRTDPDDDEAMRAFFRDCVLTGLATGR